jgi:hypothetical protein
VVVFAHSRLCHDVYVQSHLPYWPPVLSGRLSLVVTCFMRPVCFNTSATGCQ